MVSANERLNGYVDPELAYKLPVEFTEWNIKCWGPGAKNDPPLPGGDFEDGLNGWTVVSSPEGERKGGGCRRRRPARQGRSAVENDERRCQVDRSAAEVFHRRFEEGRAIGSRGMGQDE